MKIEQLEKAKELLEKLQTLQEEIGLMEKHISQCEGKRIIRRLFNINNSNETYKNFYCTMTCDSIDCTVTLDEQDVMAVIKCKSEKVAKLQTELSEL